MARKASHAPLNVYLNGRLVGQFRRDTTGAVDFRYAEAWLAWEYAIPVSLSLPLREDRYIGAPVLAVFDNLLPDNAEIRRTLAERTGAPGTDPYNLLAAIGRDCVGALQFLPDGSEPPDVSRIESRPVSDAEIADIVANLGRNPLGVGGDKAFRISIAGAQEKTALLQIEGQWHLPHGTTATTHIIKPQLGVLANGIDMSRSVENEHYCMVLAQAFGLPVATTRIHDFAGRRVLSVQRFDRIWSRDGRLLRIPQEDFCQALSVPSTRKYQSDGGPTSRDVLDVLKGSDAPALDRRTFLKAHIFFWLIAATDGHAKNFSIALSSGGRFRLTPLYDILSTQPAFDAGQIQKKRFRLAMSAGKNRHYPMDRILPRHFVQEAEAAGLPAGTAEAIFAELQETAPAAIEHARAAAHPEMPEALIGSVEAALRMRLQQMA